MNRLALTVAVAAALTSGIAAAGASAAGSLGSGAAKSHAARALAEKYGFSWSRAGSATKSLDLKMRQSPAKVRLSYFLATTVEKEGTCPGPHAAAAECTPAEAQQETYTGIVIVWRPAAEPREIRSRVVQKSGVVGPCTIAC